MVQIYCSKNENKVFFSLSPIYIDKVNRNLHSSLIFLEGKAMSLGRDVVQKKKLDRVKIQDTRKHCNVQTKFLLCKSERLPQ